MTRDEVVQLLAVAAIVDGDRGWHPNQLDVDAWHLVLDDRTTLDDAKAAVAAHYREMHHRITPSDVHRRSKAMRAARTPQIAPPVGVPKPAGWPGPETQAAIEAAKRKLAASGFTSYADALGQLGGRLQPIEHGSPGIGPHPGPLADCPICRPSLPVAEPDTAGLA